MLRFLTDELQEAEDAGDRGLLLCGSFESFDIQHGCM